MQNYYISIKARKGLLVRELIVRGVQLATPLVPLVHVLIVKCQLDVGTLGIMLPFQLHIGMADQEECLARVLFV